MGVIAPVPTCGVAPGVVGPVIVAGGVLAVAGVGAGPGPPAMATIPMKYNFFGAPCMSLKTT